jgi:branched-chain amino acid transport system substrate-binding protein
MGAHAVETPRTVKRSLAVSRRVTLAIGIVAVAVLAGCTPVEPEPTPTPSVIASVAPTGDGVLRIGTLFPMGGDLSSAGPAMVAAVEVAVRDINVAGGVLGVPVEVFSRNSGVASEQLLEVSFAALVERGIDVIVGPTEAELAARLLPLAEAAGVVVLAPAAIASAVRDGDTQGVFFSTVLADDQFAAGIVETLAADNAQSLAVITSADALGAAFESSAREAAESADLLLTSVDQLDAATTPDRLAASVADAEPDAVIIATGSASAEQNQGILQALIAKGLDPERLWLVGQAVSDYVGAFDEGTLEGVNGVLEGATPSDEFIARLLQSDPALRMFSGSAAAYDAVVLAALAATLANDDGGPSIAAQLRSAASGGVACTSFGECLKVLQTEPAIDYEGLSGPLTLNDEGDASAGEIALYRYTAENLAERVGTLPVSSR